MAQGADRIEPLDDSVMYIVLRSGPPNLTLVNHWPVGMGFEYFNGFVRGDTSQWQSNLFRNTTAIYPYLGNPQWNLTTAMAADAVLWLNRMNDIDPGLPFFSYYTPSGTHAPHHPTPEWMFLFRNLLCHIWLEFQNCKRARCRLGRRTRLGSSCRTGWQKRSVRESRCSERSSERWHLV